MRVTTGVFLRFSARGSALGEDPEIEVRFHTNRQAGCRENNFENSDFGQLLPRPAIARHSSKKTYPLSQNLKSFKKEEISQNRLAKLADIANNIIIKIK